MADGRIPAGSPSEHRRESRSHIENGTYPADRALPSIRTLQQTYGIADGTIQKALAILKAEGLVRAVRGRGVYVTSRN